MYMSCSCLQVRISLNDSMCCVCMVGFHDVSDSILCSNILCNAEPTLKLKKITLSLPGIV